MQHKRIITPPSSPPPHNSNSHQQQRPATRTKAQSHRNYGSNNNGSSNSHIFLNQELSWRRSGKTAQQQQQHTRAPQENQIWKNCELALEKLCSHHEQHGNGHHQSENNEQHNEHNEQLIDSTGCIFHMLHSQVQQLVQQVSYPDATLHSTQIFKLFSRIESIFHHFSLFQHITTTNNNKNDSDSSDPNDDQSGENGENDGNDGSGGGDDENDLSLINFTSHFCQLIILLITKQKVPIVSVRFFVCQFLSFKVKFITCKKYMKMLTHRTSYDPIIHR